MAASPKTWTDNSAPQCNASDLNGFNQEINNAVSTSGQTLDYSDHNQTAKAMATYSACGTYYVDSGSANNYVLSPQGTRQIPSIYIEGEIIRFIPQNGNTGPATANAGSRGSKNILNTSGDPLVDGEITGGREVELFYDGTNLILRNNQALIGSTVNDNIIIGGNFGTNPWQRGVSFSFSSSDSDFLADRFLFEIGPDSTAEAIVSRDTEVPPISVGGAFSKYSTKILCTAADTTLSGSFYSAYSYRIEGYDFQIIAQRYFTIRFCVRASKTGIYCLALKNKNLDRSYVAEYEINTANTWEEKIIIVAPSPSSGTWDYENLIGLYVEWQIMPSSLNTATGNSWITGNFGTTSNQVNLLDTVGATFYINMIKIEPGTVFTGFSEPSIAETFTKCQRYFFKTYSDGDYPGNSNKLTGYWLYLLTKNLLTDDLIDSFSLPNMNRAPDVTLYSPITGAANKIRNFTTNADIDGSADQIGNRGLNIKYTALSSIIIATDLGAHIVANAELY